MCYDISFTTRIELITDYLPGIVADPQITFDFENGIHVLAQAHANFPVVIFEDGTYKLKEFEWGVIADYMNTAEKIKKNRSWMCNAQSEKIVGDSNSYWYRIRSQRCLVPVNGTFEHREIRGWKNKVPYHVKQKDRQVFFLPGLYNYGPLPNLETGEVKGTFTIITRPANDIMRFIHNGGPNAYRMPLFLTPELELEWLQPSLSDEEVQEILNYELPSEMLEYWPVHTIRSPKERPDGLEKTAPWQWPGLPELGSDGPLKPEQQVLF